MHDVDVFDSSRYSTSSGRGISYFESLLAVSTSSASLAWSSSSLTDSSESSSTMGWVGGALGFFGASALIFLL